jgi:hypothetical protein
MNDIIIEAIASTKKTGKSLEVVVRYLRMKWRIEIDLNALKKRLDVQDITRR